MKLTEEENQQVVAWYRRYLDGEAKFSELEDILFKGPGDRSDEYEEEGVVSFVSPEDIDVDTDQLAEDLGLEEGEEPSDEQITEHQKSVWEDEVCCGGEFYCNHYYLYCLPIGDETIWVMCLHGDGGYRDDFQGPFDSAEDCLSGATWIDRIPVF